MSYLNIRWQRFDKKKRIIALWAIIGVTTGLGIFIWKFSDFNLNQETLVLPPSNIKIQTYSVSGKVDSVGKDRIFYTAPVAYSAGENVTIKYEPRIALVDEKTEFTKSSFISGKISYRAIKLSDIKKGDKAIFYFSVLPYDKSETLASKIDLPVNY